MKKSGIMVTMPKTIKPYPIYFKDKDGNRYTKQYVKRELESYMIYEDEGLYRVMVIQDRDYDWTFTWEWTFDNEQDAQDKVRFIEQEWNDPPLTKYDQVWYSKVYVEKEQKYPHLVS